MSSAREDLSAIKACYLLGQAAAVRGEPLDACRYRRADRRNAWVRGWHAGDDQRLQLEAFRAERRGMPRIPLPAPARGSSTESSASVS